MDPVGTIGDPKGPVGDPIGPVGDHTGSVGDPAGPLGNTTRLGTLIDSLRILLGPFGTPLDPLGTLLVLALLGILLDLFGTMWLSKVVLKYFHHHTTTSVIFFYFALHYEEFQNVHKNSGYPIHILHFCPLWICLNNVLRYNIISFDSSQEYFSFPHSLDLTPRGVNTQYILRGAVDLCVVELIFRIKGTL